MNLDHVTFRSAIEGKSVELGRAPTPHQIDALEAVMQTFGRYDANANALLVEETEGQPVPLFDYLDAAVAKFPAKPAPEPSKPAPQGPKYVQASIGSTTSYRRADDGMVVITQALQAPHEARLIAEAKQWPNPWSPQHLNRTRQVVLARMLPDRAAQFKAQAGVQ